MKIDILRKPYGRHKKIVEAIYYDNEERAAAEHKLIGGERIEAVTLDELEHIKELVLDEVACLIDDMSTDAPGSPRNLESGSSEWDVFKVEKLNLIRRILDGDFSVEN